MTAQYNLGRCYVYGEGVTKDLAAAARYWARAGASGHADALVALGDLYCDLESAGTGVPLDFVRAYACYHAASATGHEGSGAKCDALKAILTADQIADAKKISGDLKTLVP